MTMVEKVARAIDPVAWQNLTDSAWIGSALLRQRNARNTALAALKAMRNPDQDLIDLMDRELGNGECRKWAEASWITVIDAAIAEHAATAIGNRRA